MGEHIKIHILPEMLDSRSTLKAEVCFLIPRKNVDLYSVGNSRYIYLQLERGEYSYMLTPEAFIQISNQLLGISNDRNQTHNPPDTSVTDNIPRSPA